MDRRTYFTDKVPPEVWLEIFKQVPKSGDLYGLNTTSRQFHNLSTRALHRDLVWIDEEHAVQSLDVWERNSGLDACVRSLIMGVGCGRAMTMNDTRSGLTYFPSSSTQVALWSRVEKFTNISSLEFRGSSISNYHFRLIHNLPQLRSLRLIDCTVDRIAADGFNSRTLPITELYLVAVRRSGQSTTTQFSINLGAFNVAQIQQAHAAQQALTPAPGVAAQESQPHQLPRLRDPLSRALSVLSTAMNLRTLTIDLSTDIFRDVFRALAVQGRVWVVPERLENLYIFHTTTVTSPRIQLLDEEADEIFINEVFDDDPYRGPYLYQFCAQARSLKTISTPAFAPSRVTMDPEDLPSGLEAFAAPMDAAQFVATHRDVKALGVLQCELEQHEAIGALTLIAHARPGLKLLLFEVKTWDAALVSAIAQHFTQLRHLKLVYGCGNPDEDFLVALSQYLTQMPDLHTLEMYKLPPNGNFEAEHPDHLYDSSWGSIEEELRDIVIPWARFSPRLRRVQLVSGYIIERAYEGATWNLEKIDKLNRVEYLAF